MKSVVLIVVLGLVFLVSAAAAAHPLGVSDTLPAISVSPAILNFGRISVSDTKELTISIKNSSDTALTLDCTTDSVLDAPFAVVSGGGSFSLDSGASNIITISFMPYRVGNETDSLVITSNTDSARARLVIYFYGTGFIADTIARINVSPLTLDFGTAYVGHATAATFTITNVTNTNLPLSGTIINAHTPFSVGQPGNFLLDSGQKSVNAVHLTPSDTGVYFDSVIINSNTDNSTKRIVVYLKATVLPASALLPQISIQSFTLNFGTMTVDPASDNVLTFTIKNISDSARTLDVNLLFPNDPFSVTGSNTQLVLTQHESQDLDVHFVATTVGTFKDSIIVISNAPESRIPVYMTATVVSKTNSVANDADAASLIVSPNPTEGIVHINNLPQSVEQISVVDVLGKTVMQLNVRDESDASLDLSSLPSGVYYMRIINANSVITKMVARQ